jgi:hypothetical protein
MSFPQTHHTNTGRPVQVDQAQDGTISFHDGDLRLATLNHGEDRWELVLASGDTKLLPGGPDDPPIEDVIVQIDLREDEDEYSGEDTED